jgi:hypothetical protein
MYTRLMLAILASVVLCTFGHAQHKPCTPAQRLEAEKEAMTLRSWDALYKSYQRYGHCSDVDAAEGYSESVARILADNWDTLPRLSQLIERDREFEKFVGLDATMSMKDVAKIKDSAVQHCPKGLKNLCNKLRDQADSAIAEDAVAHRRK